MDVEFRTKKLRECFEQHAQAQRAWGPEVARRYVERTGILYNVASIQDLGKLPSLHLHALHGNRKGQYALTLVGRWRLIVAFREGPPPIVRIEEVSKHYGD